MERVSALMDGELEQDEATRLIPALRQRDELRDAWSTYHLIGDALRGQPCMDCTVARSVSAQLAAEPTVLAPRAQRAARGRDVKRWALPSLAAAAAVATVTWMSLETQQAGNAPQFVVPANHIMSTGHFILPHVPAAPDGTAHDPISLGSSIPASQSQPAPQIQFSARELQPYLMAHQEFSPSTAIQGLAPYVRTVVSNALER